MASLAQPARPHQASQTLVLATAEEAGRPEAARSALGNFCTETDPPCTSPRPHSSP